ncbi:hypothetical protein TNCV_1833721 [Trichonephila clavipes]|nr:hypothetical protein TNCV_1833721 [Trichonephila clavipes]
MASVLSEVFKTKFSLSSLEYQDGSHQPLYLTVTSGSWASSGFLTVSKVAGVITKDKNSQYFKSTRVHRKADIPSTKRSRLFNCVARKLHTNV